MSPNFVDHLKKIGILTPQQSARVEVWASGRHDPVGIIAVEHGMIIGRQIDDVLGRQRDWDRRFGEIAVEMGYLNEGQLEKLLEIQRFRDLARVAEAVILAGLAPSGEILRAYARFVLDHEGGEAAVRSAAA
jgi:hypothetical protein